jgi:hypothetical protein
MQVLRQGARQQATFSIKSSTPGLSPLGTCWDDRSNEDGRRGTTLQKMQRVGEMLALAKLTRTNSRASR